MNFLILLFIYLVLERRTIPTPWQRRRPHRGAPRAALEPNALVSVTVGDHHATLTQLHSLPSVLSPVRWPEKRLVVSTGFLRNRPSALISYTFCELSLRELIGAVAHHPS